MTADETNPKIKVYGTRWCYDTRVSLAFLSKNHIRGAVQKVEDSPFTFLKSDDSIKE